MTKCRDCLHVDICEHYAKTLNQKLAQYCNIQIPFEKEKPHSEPCEFFKDRSRFVELPCKVGDSYFEIEQYCTERGFYNEPQQTDIMDCEYCDVDGVCDRQYRIAEKRFISLIQIFEYKEKAVNRYNRKFLTKEQAEQALKERENK